MSGQKTPPPPGKSPGQKGGSYNSTVETLTEKVMRFVDFQEKVENYPVQLEALQENVNSNARKVDSIAADVKHLTTMTSNLNVKFENLCTGLLQRLPLQNNNNYSSAAQGLSQQNFPPLPQTQGMSHQGYPPPPQTQGQLQQPQVQQPAPQQQSLHQQQQQQAAAITPPSTAVSQNQQSTQSQPPSQRSSLASNSSSLPEVKLVSQEEFMKIMASIPTRQDMSIKNLQPHNLHYQIRKLAKGSRFYLYYSDVEADKFEYENQSLPNQDIRTKTKYKIMDHARRLILFPFHDKDFTHHAEIQKTTGTSMVRSMVIEFFVSYCLMPLDVAESLEITAIKPMDNDTSFTPRSLEIVFGSQEARELIEPYRSNMLRERKKIKDEKWWPQMKLSVPNECWGRFTEIQSTARKFRNAHSINPETPEYGTRLTYDTETFMDFKLETRDKSNVNNPWIHRKEITDDPNKLLPSIWSQKNSAIQRRNKAISDSKKSNSGKRKKDFTTQITPEGKKKIPPVVQLLRDGDTPSFDSALNRMRDRASSSGSQTTTTSENRNNIMISNGLAAGIIDPNPLPILDPVNRNPDDPPANVDVLQGAPNAAAGGDALGTDGAGAGAGLVDGAGSVPPGGGAGGQRSQTMTQKSGIPGLGRGAQITKKCEYLKNTISYCLLSIIEAQNVQPHTPHCDTNNGTVEQLNNALSESDTPDIIITSSPNRNLNSPYLSANTSPILPNNKMNITDDSDMSFVSAGGTDSPALTSDNTVITAPMTSSHIQTSNQDINRSELNYSSSTEHLRVNSYSDSHNISHLQESQDDEPVAREWSKKNHCCNNQVCNCPKTRNTVNAQKQEPQF